MRDVYLELKQKNYGLFKSTINFANMLSINLNLSLQDAAGLELALVSFVVKEIK